VPPLTARIASGVVVAVVLALLLAVPRLFGVEMWKWVLGVAGLALFLVGGIEGRKDRSL
jgi:hypothetical protein